MFHYLSGTFIIQAFQKILSLSVNICSRWLMQSFRELDFLHQENPLKIRIEVNLKMQVLVHMMHEWKFPSQTVAIFAWTPKKHDVYDGKLNFILSNPGCFSLITVFNWSNWEQYLFNCFLCQKVLSYSNCTWQNLLWIKIGF